MSSARNQSGLTLVELVVSIVIVSIALVAIVSAVSVGLNRSGETLVQLQAVGLAQSYLDEIMGKRFDENSANNGIPPCRDPALPGVPPPRRCTLEAAFGPEGGETPGTYTRERFDDVDDYHLLDEGSGGANPLLDADGNPRTGYDNFRVEVEVRYLNLVSALPGEVEEFGTRVNTELDDQYDAKLVIVRISDGGLGSPVEYTSLKVNF